MIRTLDLPLERDAASKLVPWVIAFMVYLGILALTSVLSLNGFLKNWQHQERGSFTVALPSQNVPADKILEWVNTQPMVDQARIVPTAELERILVGWSGATTITADQLPILIEATLKHGTVESLSNLEAELRTIVPEATLEDHRKWQIGAKQLIQTGLWIFGAIATMVALVTALTIGLISYSGLLIHKNTLEILDLVGASQNYIARQFQIYSFWLTVKGVIAGMAAAALTGILLLFVMKGADINTVLGALPIHAVLIAIIVVPVVALLITLVTSRVTVLKTLESFF